MNNKRKHLPSYCFQEWWEIMLKNLSGDALKIISWIVLPYGVIAPLFYCFH